ncbi:MAG: HD domain-containing protein [Flavobacteriales bacterium]|nr:HD domain-containing protein [Flavobacteriales bacterium]
MNNSQNNLKILNDPVYGFISLPHKIFLDIIDHPYFQRLRRIKQLGLSHLVYPGALHTRFNHAVGCAHLMTQAINTLQFLGHEITPEEAKGVTLAILLHDIGHGPFSHTLEHSIVSGIKHEEVSILFMKELNREFRGELDLAIKIFSDKYHKRFLHQLVSSQLDMDRLDYLKRDSFYSGVSEGVVSNQRIIKMFDVVNDSLVVKQKGIYSIEKFIVARRLMYWQVYLHKTVLSAEFLLMKILKRAKYIALGGEIIFSTTPMKTFLFENIDAEKLRDPQILRKFAQLDDMDIFVCIKEWINSSDPVLAELSRMLVTRNLLKVEQKETPFTQKEIDEFKNKYHNPLKFNDRELEYFIFQDSMTNNAYDSNKDEIKILYKNGTLKDITEASDNFNIQSLSNPVKKYYLFHPE